MNKKAVSIGGLLLSLLAIGNTALAATSMTFVDVDSHTDYFNAINWAIENGVATGYGDDTWRPNNCVKRAELVKMVMESRPQKGPTNSKMENPFPDIKPTEWYYNYANEAKSMNFISGYSDGAFRGYLCVNRAEAMKIATNAMFGNPPLNKTSGDIYFDDKLVVDIKSSDWFMPYARFLFKDRLVGTNHTASAGYTVGTVPLIPRIYFYPAGEMTRKEVAQMLYLISNSARFKEYIK